MTDVWELINTCEFLVNSSHSTWDEYGFSSRSTQAPFVLAWEVGGYNSRPFEVA